MRKLYTKKLLVPMEASQYEALQVYAKASGRSMASVMRLAVQSWLSIGRTSNQMPLREGVGGNQEEIATDSEEEL